MSTSPSIRPSRRVHPGLGELPASLQSVPAPKISLQPLRSLLPDLGKYSLLAPAAGPRRNRGHGLLAGLLAVLVVSVMDGLSGAGGAPPATAALIVAHAAAVMVAPGALFGALLEALLAAAARVTPALRLWRWVAQGPRRWFFPDPGLTTRLTLALVGPLLLVGAVFAVSGFVVSHLHSKLLMALSISLALAAALVLAPLALLLLTVPLRSLLERVRNLASPGALGLAVAALLVPLSVRAYEGNRAWIDLVDRRPLYFTAAVPVVVAAALLGLRRVVRRPLGREVFAVLVGALSMALALSAETLGQSRVVSRAVVARTFVVGPTVQALRRATDRDGDGVSAVFGAEDCDDADPRVHPLARDIPGNGIDENCTGDDARPLDEHGRGRYAAYTGLPAGAAPSILLVTVDTLRPDHLGAYGYRRPTSPNIDAFARRAARFEHFYTTAPRTVRSLSAIWTGRYPSHIDWGDDIAYPALNDVNRTLAEQLAEAGYETAAFVGTDYFRLTEGFFQGFGRVEEGQDFKGDSQRATRGAADWIAGQGGRPFFAWVHLLDPHAPYREGGRSRSFGPSEVDRYDDEIARADAALAPLLEAAARFEREHPERPLVTVVTADHGEGLHAHGSPTHGIDLHREAVQVPLLVRAPGVAPGQRAALGSLVDLHATLLNYANVPAVGMTESRSLIPALRGGDAGRERVFAEVTPDGLVPYEQKMIVAPPWTLIWDVRHGGWELYDGDDRRQRHNLVDERPEVVRRLSEDLLSWTADTWASRRDLRIVAARLAREPAPEHRVGARFGDVLDLLGYDVRARVVPAGGTLHMNFYYRVRSRTRELYTIGLWMIPGDVAPRVDALDASHFPVLGHYPTTEWNPGEILRDEVHFRIDERAQPARMRIRFSVRTRADARVVPTGVDTRDAELDLGEFTITPR